MIRRITRARARGRLITALLFVAAGASLAQAPKVGAVNLYGLHEIKPADLLAALGIDAGAPLPASKLELEQKLGAMPNVELATVEAVCCERGDALLFIGIEETGALRPEFRSDPEGIAALPQELVDLFRAYDVAERRAAAANPAQPDAGRAALKGTPAQQRLAATAALHADLIRATLRNASDGEHRAMAAALIPLLPQRKTCIPDLQFALTDPESGVRASAVRSLRSLIHEGAGGEISAEWFLPLLRSAVLSDRLESVEALAAITARGNAPALEAMRSAALPALAEMARWKGQYGRTPFLLLGRIVGVPATEIDSAWQGDNRERIIARALATAPAPSR